MTPQERLQGLIGGAIANLTPCIRYRPTEGPLPGEPLAQMVLHHASARRVLEQLVRQVLTFAAAEALTASIPSHTGYAGEDARGALRNASDDIIALLPPQGGGEGRVGR